MVSSSEQITSSVRSSIEINNIEVEVLANDDLYERKSQEYPKVLTIVQGEFVDLTTIRNQRLFGRMIDLIGLTEGVHIVNLSPNGLFSQG